MNSEILVDARGLAKSYPQVFRRSDRLRALLSLLAGRGNNNAVEVLCDIDLVVRRGESLALIGENGAGKSTLLKLLTGVLTPSRGSVRLSGRVGALLELGAGFHPEYSGRDNIATAAALYGLTAQEALERTPEIIAFADIGRYIDEPVKHYSSGMVVRLGFAVVAALRPDLLVTDEVLAVGDESFQKKCVRWIEDYLSGGGTLLLVSHSMYHVQKLCTRACWLKEGRVAALGDVFDVSQQYLAYHERKSAAAPASRAEVAARGLEFHVENVELNGRSEALPLLLEVGSDLSVRTLVSSRDGREPVLVVGIARADGTPVYGVGSDMDGARARAAGPGRFEFVFNLANLALLPGSYNLKVHPMDPEAVRLFDTVERPFTVRGASREFGLVRLPHQWGEPGP